jgi:muramoyltetrapeptide carboxypeptidase
MLLPPSLGQGAQVRVIAPSGPFNKELLSFGLSRLSRYSVIMSKDFGSQPDGFFAATDEGRLEELQSALDCPETAAIWVARGGYGLARLLPHLSFEAFSLSPKWFIGFSDATALHHRLHREGFATLHAPNGTTLSRLTATDEIALFQCLEGTIGSTYTSLTPLNAGVFEGILQGGNLTVLFAEAAAGRLALPTGSILFLEDVTETSYRIDRMLDALIAGGHFQNVGAILLGDFTDCSPGKFGVETASVLKRNLLPLRVPTLGGFPAGHGERNAPLVLGAKARLDADKGQLETFQG